MDTSGARPPVAPGTDDDPTAGASPPTQRLWTPWRMAYVGGAATEQGCIFCNRLGAEDDVRSLILHRGEHAFIIMNRYPYNTGHVMIVPNTHLPSPEEADPMALTEMATALPVVLRALRRVLHCDGFNVGMNVGEIAGAGVAAHLHQHVVPRWVGDANFMPILASTMVLPELLPVTYAKLRAEVGREFAGTSAVGQPIVAVVLSPDNRDVLTVAEGEAVRLPTARPDPDEAIWRSASSSVMSLLGDDRIELVGWAGASKVMIDEPMAVTFHLPDRNRSPGREQHAGLRFQAIESALARLTDAAERGLVRSAVTRLSPGVDRDETTER